MGKLHYLIAFLFIASLTVSAQCDLPDLTATQQLACAQKFNFFTIPNQDAAFVRMPSRGASTEIDAVFHNPAGLAFLDDGWHFSFNNQALRQKTNIDASYQHLNETPSSFEGIISSPIFPSVYLAYKKKNISFSWALNPIAGGGGAEFKGLPVAERNIADIVPNIKNILTFFDNLNLPTVPIDSSHYNISGYEVDFSSNGLAFFLGNQLGISYKLHKTTSFYGGVRYIYGRVSFDGHTRNIRINVPEHGGWQRPGAYLRSINPMFLGAAADALDGNTANREIDAFQTTFGFTPLVGLHFSPNEKLHIGLRYEHRTVMKFTTTVNDGKDGKPIDENGDPVPNELGLIDDFPIFVDGAVSRSDLPGLVGGGISYDVIPKLKVALGGRYILNTKANFDGREASVTNNYYELESAIEYAVNDELKLSAGYTFGNWRLDDEYQTDVDFWTNSHTIAFGGNYALSKKLDFNMGFLTTKFVEHTYDFTHTPIPAPPIIPNLPEVAPSAASNVYSKNAVIFAIGVNVHWLK